MNKCILKHFLTRSLDLIRCHKDSVYTVNHCKSRLKLNNTNKNTACITNYQTLFSPDKRVNHAYLECDTNFFA